MVLFVCRLYSKTPEDRFAFCECKIVRCSNQFGLSNRCRSFYDCRLAIQNTAFAGIACLLGAPSFASVSSLQQSRTVLRRWRTLEFWFSASTATPEKASIVVGSLAYGI